MDIAKSFFGGFFVECFNCDFYKSSFLLIVSHCTIEYIPCCRELDTRNQDRSNWWYNQQILHNTLSFKTHSNTVIEIQDMTNTGTTKPEKFGRDNFKTTTNNNVCWFQDKLLLIFGLHWLNIEIAQLPVRHAWIGNSTAENEETR